MKPLSKDTDTIVAIATPAGSGAIAVIRLSGAGAFEIADKVFHAKNKSSITGAKGYTVHFGEIRNGDKLLDEVLSTVFRAPHSYTGEDVVEISCHGSLYIQQQVVKLLVNKGARLALPG